MRDTKAVHHALSIHVVQVFGPAGIAQASDKNPTEHPYWHVGHAVQEIVACGKALDSVLHSGRNALLP